jgi:hypothetical protein
VHQDGGDWKGSGGVPQGESWAAEAEDYSVMLGGDAFLGNDLVHGGGVPGVQEMLMSGIDLSKLDDAVVDSLWASAMMNSLTANQAAAHPLAATNYTPPMFSPAEPNQVSAAASPGLMPQMPAYPPAMDYQQAPPMVPAAGPNQLASGSPGPSTQVGSVPSPGLTSQMPAYHPAMDYPQAPPMVLAAEPNQVSAAASPGMMPQMPAYPPAMDYPQAASFNIPQAVQPDDEKAEVSQMVRAAARCGAAVPVPPRKLSQR